ncbi:potassium channel family protein [Sediminibacterium sp. TEGAF015]|uniref:potassium channel family protein n=1 Tax=Sediminibacterium sp. TEGAF015 TaxID=575378 RepID=UPI0021FC5A8C|nr:potassium channel family protein [Sediminibacterium sp. TEGAF015]BDQ11689.1 ion transporter [Sediminibacterium sp. TEGAF015]
MEHTKNKNNVSQLNLVIIILSIYVLLALTIDTFFQLPKEVSRTLNILDNIICIVFLIDFCIQLYKSENKLKFLKWGWIDLISSIPTLDIMRAGRMLRLIRLLRILRAFRSTKNLVHYIFKNKTKGALTSASIIAVLMIIFSSVAILQFETNTNSNIKTAEDAIWWSYVTITTVGYGDKFPVTTEGRIIAAILMTVGVGLFGTFTAYLASWFLEQTKIEHENDESNIREN